MEKGLPGRTARVARVAFALLAFALLAGCGGGSDSSPGPPPPPPRDAFSFHVSPAGFDNGDGSALAPFRTITKGLASATVAGDNVLVAPGTYTAATGESFPLDVPPGVGLYGNEAGKGSDTAIVGGAATFNHPVVGLVSVTLIPRDNAVVAGFRVTNDLPGPVNRIAVLSDASGVTIRNNRATGNSYTGVHIYGGSGQVVHGNRLDNNYVGLGVITTTAGGAGATARVDNNVITGNSFGVSLGDTETYCDLGGGTSGSAGGNVLAGNVQADLYSAMGGILTPVARNNFWDRVPPVQNTFVDTIPANRADIVGENGVPVDTTGAQIYSPPPP